MKSFGGLWERIVSRKNLEAAMIRAATGKRNRPPVARFLANADEKLALLEQELRQGVYQPLPFAQFRIRDPKPRTMPGYVRYMDDIAVWSDDKDSLWWLRERTAKWLGDERGLKLKAEATRVAPSAEGLPFLGLRVFPGGLRLQRGRFLRLRRLVNVRERAWREGRLDAAELAASVQAATGILKFWGLRGLAASALDV